MLSYPIHQALELAKDFTSSRRKSASSSSRPALCGAFVEEEYVWATNATWLIRIKHNEIVETSYIFGYSPEDTRYFSSGNTNYPNCHAIVPNLMNYSCVLEIENLQEWINVHEQVCALKHNGYHTTLNTYDRTVRAKSMEKGVFGNSMAFLYRDLPFEESGEPSKLYYDASKMVKILKLFKKLQVRSIKFRIFGARKPFVMEAEDVLILVLPFSEEYQPVPEKKKPEPKPKKEPKPKPEPKPKKEPKQKSKPKPKTKSAVKKGKK